VGSIGRYKPANEMAMMASIKRLFDPLGLFNPGRVIAAD